MGPSPRTGCLGAAGVPVLLGCLRDVWASSCSSLATAPLACWLCLPLGSAKTPQLLSQNTQILQNTAEGWGQGCAEGRMGLEPDLG